MQSEIPQRFRELIAGSAFAGETLAFAERCDRILVDNEMVFFPAYTDHGTSHVGSVLKAAERLIPEDVWEEGLLEPCDAAVLTSACFLHDLALHIREPGFLALTADGSPFAPLPWFGEDQRSRPRDTPWPRLWHEFRREARRFSRSQLNRILGPSHGEPPQIVFGDADTDPAEWTLADRLLIGEFLRRHHARLAHEIAIYGFPGIEEGEFPALASSLPSLAEAIGATARSHGEDLRVVSDYLESRGKGDLRPDGAAQLYLMGVLRIADYFQLEAERATPLLMHLREPQSPVSVEEWRKHQAIGAISWEHRDPHAVTLQITPAHNLRTHLQLSDLIADLQHELDLTAAVLAETYSSSRLSRLQLRLRRVRTNLHEPDLHRRLSFVPKRARMRSAEDLFRLVIDDLYGNEPAVAGRELLQNAVDAVREREWWEARRGTRLNPERFRSQEVDVVVEVREIDDENGTLRISDRGIGMSVSTVIESFLAAGATFTPSSAEMVDPEVATPVKWMKAGRFGIVVFAAFLLGSAIQVTTRHPDDEKGLTFTATMGDDLVQLDWQEDAPLGTEILVPYPTEALPEPAGWIKRQEGLDAHGHLLATIREFFVLERPKIEFLLREREEPLRSSAQIGGVPDPDSALPDDWRTLAHPDFDAIQWSLPAVMGTFQFAHWNARRARLAHNGILIRKPSDSGGGSAYRWADAHTRDIVEPPSLAVFDTKQALRLALNRYELAEPSLPFEAGLLESIGLDLVAHALALGTHPHPLAEHWGLRPLVSRTRWLPLVPALVHNYIDGDVCILIVNDAEYQVVGMLFERGATKGDKWRQVPYRAVLSSLELFSEDMEELEWKTDDALHQDHAEKEVTGAVDEFTRLFGMWPATGVLVRPTGSQVITSLYEEEDERLELLENMGKELSELSDFQGDFFALVMMSHIDPFEDEDEPVDDDDWYEPLALPWEEIIGGMLDRSDRGRQKRAREIVKRDSRMRDLVARWERLAKTHEPPA